MMHFNFSNPYRQFLVYGITYENAATCSAHIKEGRLTALLDRHCRGNCYISNAIKDLTQKNSQQSPTVSDKQHIWLCVALSPRQDGGTLPRLHPRSVPEARHRQFLQADRLPAEKSPRPESR